MTQQGEGDAPLSAIAGDGGRFLIEANDGADALDEIAAFEAHRVAACEVSALQWLWCWRERRPVRVQLDRRIGHPPVLRRSLGEEQQLIGLELGDATLLHPVDVQIPELNFLAEMQVLTHGENARWTVQQVINGGAQAQQVEISRLLQGTHDLMQIHAFAAGAAVLGTLPREGHLSADARFSRPAAS